MGKFAFLLVMTLGHVLVYGQNTILSREAKPKQGKIFLNQAKNSLYSNQLLKASKEAKHALFFLRNDTTAIKETMRAYYVLGIIYSARKMPDQSKIYYLAALYYLKKLPPAKRKKFTYTIYNSLGSLYYKTSPKKAIRYLKQALQTTHKDHLLALINLSLAYASKAKKMPHDIGSKKALEKALEYAHKALGALDEAKHKAMVIERNRAVIFHNMGIVYQHQAQGDSANAYFKKSLKSLNKANALKHSLHFYNYIKLGELCQRQKKWQQANKHFDQAIEKIRSGGAPTLGYLQALSGKAKALSKHYQNNSQELQNVLPYFYGCDSLARHLQKSQQNYHDQLHSANHVAHGYETAFETCFRLYQQTNNKRYIQHAFYFMERAKGQLLWLEKLKNQRSVIAAKNCLLLDSLAHTRRQIAQTKIDSHKLALYAKLAKFSQEMKPWSFGSDTLQSIDDIQKKIKSTQTVIISYFVASGFLYGLVIGKKRLTMKRLATMKTVEGLASKFVSCIKNFTCAYPKLIPKGDTLYQHIFAPLKAVLPLQGNLVIIPTQILWKVPFDALPIGKKISYEAPANNHLLSKYAISYNYSVNLWGSTSPRKNPKNYSPYFVGIAPGFNTKACSLLQLSPLPQTLPETDFIAQLYASSQVLKAEQADLTNALKILRQRVHTIQFATHSNGSSMPYIQLMPLSKQDKYGSRLYLENIYQLRPQAQLVILSSCRSGDGILHQTEGILGLGRGFVQTGVPTVMFSLWNVEDNQSTTHLMSSFHQGIRPKTKQNLAINYALALQQAKIAAIHRHQRAISVTDWAGFQLISHHSNQ